MSKLVWGVTASALLFAGCGDDDSSGTPDATPTPTPDAPVDETPDAAEESPDAAEGTPDAAPQDGFQTPTPIALRLSASGHDQLQSAVAAPGGGFYAAGYIQAILDGVKDVVVVKLTAAGAIDTTWSGDGIASTGMVFIGTDDEIDIALQSDGKILVSAAVPHATPGGEDSAVARLNADGTVDAMFGTGGRRFLGLRSATGGNAGPRGLAVDATDRIYIHAVEQQVREGGGTDADFAVIRLTAAGVIDNSFSGDGKQLLNIVGGTAEAPTNLGATVRGVSILSDGSVIASGYLSNALLGAAGPAPVVFKLDTNGEFVAGFGTPGGVANIPPGVFHAKVLGHQTEVYNVAIQGDKLITAGYGRETNEPNNNAWVTTQIDATTGAINATWGGTTNGGVMIRPSELSSNCRNAIALPDGKTMLIGSTGPMTLPMGSPPHPSRDAAFAIVNEDGALDEAFGARAHVIPLGDNGGGNDQFWGGASTEETAIIVGWKGFTDTASATNNDDAYVVVFPLSK